MSDADLDLLRRHMRSDSASTRWRDLRWTPETGSTNADLAELARAGHSAPVVLVADHQSGGRGRLDRKWESPAGTNLLVSFLLAPDRPADQWGWVSAAVGLAAVEAIGDVGVDVAIKWPNDLHHEGDKVAGLLAEAITATGTLVVGIGINVGWPESADPELGATSLSALGAEVGRHELLGHLLMALDRRLVELDRSQGALAAIYRQRCTTIGSEVRVDTVGGGQITGTAVGLDDTGALLIDTGSGIEVVSVGDVHHLRPG